MAANATILVVDDNPIIRKMVQGALGAEGHSVVAAGSSQEALAVLEKQRSPSLVLVDLVLADSDGIDLLRAMRSRPGFSEVPILALSGRADERRVLEAGFDELVSKPVELHTLVTTVRSYLQRARERAVLVAEANAVQQSLLEVDTVVTHNERIWRSMAVMLGRLNALANQPQTVERALGEILNSFLDACGFSYGAAYLFGRDGALKPRARLGFTQEETETLREVLEAHHYIERAMQRGEPIAIRLKDFPADAAKPIRDSGANFLLLMPLATKEERHGVMLLGSHGEQLPDDWLTLAHALGGPVTQAIGLARSLSKASSSEHLFRGIAEAAADGIMVTDAHNRVLYVNPSTEHLFGMDEASLQATTADALVPFLQEKQTGTQFGVVTLRSGRHVPLEVVGRAFEDDSGRATRVLLFRDLTERLQLEEFSYLANHDPLTDLFNRRRFEEELTRRLAEVRRFGESGALLALDLDHFKLINDRYGHQTGDAVLRAVAQVMTSATRDTDVAARVGGDEFMLILPHTEARQAQNVARKLRDRFVEVSVDHEGTPVHVSSSIGIALFPEHGWTVKDVTAAADKALYRCKQAGRNRWAMYDVTDR